MGVTNFDEIAVKTKLVGGQIADAAIGTNHLASAAVNESKLSDPTVNGLHAARVARFEWDFAVDGGAIGNIDLATMLPINAIVLDGLVDVLTTLTTAGADAGTVALTLGAQAANMLVAAIAVSDVSNPWDAGLHDIIPVGNAATAKKATAARAVRMVIGGQAVTAGHLVGFLRYVVSE